MILIRHHNEGNLKPYFYFALEEYLLNEKLKPGETYFFTWEIHGVVVGKNQVIENEVNLEFLRENNIDVYRRPTGGGCVYADHRNTMFSIITKREDNTFSFKTYLSKIIESMRLLNVEIEFSGRNDLLFEGKKISGNSFLQNKNGMLMHGTFLYDCDLETMVRAITPSDEKLVSKGVQSVRSRVVNLKPYLNGMTQEQLIKHFENTLTNKTIEITPEEVVKIKEMAKKYETTDWIYKKQPPHTKTIKKRIQGGLFEVMLDLRDGKIQGFKILGDYFDIQPIEPFEKQFIGLEYTAKTINEVMAKNNLASYILDINQQQFHDLLLEGVLVAE